MQYVFIIASTLFIDGKLEQNIVAAAFFAGLVFLGLVVS